MGLQGLERRLERMVEGVFRRSRTTIRPIELGRRLIREMDDNRTVDVKGQRVAPNDFVIFLSPADHTSFSEIADALRTELIEACREYATEEGYHFMGPVDVELRLDPDLRAGRFGITSRISQSKSGRRPGAILLPTGERITLGSTGAVIGRMNDCEIVISDGNASRHHAQITASGSGYILADLASTNGTFINGSRLTTTHRLTDGDIITIGTVELRFTAS
ncbi:MAG: hypothetical protein CSA55_05075 [Ilumatobacter coccineus]|uniref:FHA domain-containing protein n=1 Tax=Ilumatobacter coccineus TaxID=467094 RepID=A0A2G6K7Q2_9ACTN|nr:MAG: hypothetical protein CSA55_05075 [Ilumatobacter coccineus]